MSWLKKIFEGEGGDANAPATVQMLTGVENELDWVVVSREDGEERCARRHASLRPEGFGRLRAEYLWAF